MRRGASLTSPGWRSCASPCLEEALQWGGGVAHLSGVEKLRVSVSGGGTAVRRGASLTSPGWRSCVSPCLGEALQ